MRARLTIAAGLVVGALGAGCGGTTFYDVEGGPPIADLKGKKLLVIPFTPGEIQGMANNTARDAATDAFADALFGGPFQILDRDKLKEAMQEKDLADSDLFESGKGQDLGKLMLADFFIVGKVTTCKESGDSAAPTSSEVHVSVRGIDVATGTQIFRASQRAKSTKTGLGPLHIGRTPAESAKTLLTQICKNLAAKLREPAAPASQ